MKKGIGLSTVPGEGLDEQYANAAALGFDGVEVGIMTDAAERQEHKEASGKHGVA